MSFHEHVFRQWQQQGRVVSNVSAGSIHSGVNSINVNQLQQQEYASSSDVSKPPRKRRDDTNSIIEKLYSATRVHRPGETEPCRVGARRNKNEIFGLVNSRLVKDKHLNGPKYARDVELVRGVPINSIYSDFVMILRTDGRIVTITDEVEQYLGKNMRALYAQCINIYQCLDETDGDKLRSILDSTMFDTSEQPEYRLVCTLRLPKGKRPSRTREDIKTISMTGHFYTCNDTSGERLFVARCEALVSQTNNNSKSGSQSVTSDASNSVVKLSLNDDMTIAAITSNSAKDFLGYTKNEMIGTWFGRYLSTEDLEKFESVRQSHLKSGQQPISICCILDMHTNHGDGRLTFLCQIRSMRERRMKSMKFAVVAQLIDPSLRNEYVAYTLADSKQESIKIRQVKHDARRTSTTKSSDDTSLANSPTLAMGLLRSDNISNDVGQQTSSFVRSLSTVVAPLVFIDDRQQQQWPLEWFAPCLVDDNQRRNVTSVRSIDEIDTNLAKQQYEQELVNIDLMDEFWMENL